MEMIVFHTHIRSTKELNANKVKVEVEVKVKT